MGVPVVRVSSNHGADDEMRSGHSERSKEQRRLSANSVENEESRNDGDKLDKIHDTGHQELELIVETELLKECRRVVDELGWG